MATTTGPANSYISTGASKMDAFFEWRIENFSLIAEHEELLTSQSFELEISSGHHHHRPDPTTTSTWSWEVSLKSTKEGEEKWVGVCFTGTSGGGGATAGARRWCKLRKTGENIFLDSNEVTTTEDGARANNCFTFLKVLEHKDIPNLKLVDDYLKIEMRVSLLTGNATVAAPSPFDILHSSHRKLVSDLLPTWVKNENEVYSDDVFIMPEEGDADGTGMLSSKAILSARSAEFAKLFDDSSADGDKVKVPQLSRSACHALLTFAYTGGVPHEQLDTASKIAEVAAAARKFGFPELYSYCDQLLGGKCTMSNAASLLRSAVELELSVAAIQIMEYIKMHSDSDVINTMDQNKKIGIKRIPHNYNSHEIATTGMRKEASQFTWHIENFDDVRKHKKLVEQQVIKQEIGFSFHPKAKWQFSLTYFQLINDEGDFKIWMYYELTSKLPPNSQHIYSRLYATSEGSNDNSQETQVEKFVDLRSNGLNLSKLNTWGWLVCELDTKLALVDKALHLNITIEVYSKIVESSRKCSGKAEADLEVESREKLLKDMETLYKSKNKYNDVTIFTKEGHQLSAHWRILTARSSMFQGMFNSYTTEKQSGIIHVEEISSSTMDFVLCYLYTGKLKDISDWNQLPELISAADYYNLAELLKYFDYYKLAAHVNLAVHPRSTN